jgi:hypothetical protein
VFDRKFPTVAGRPFSELIRQTFPLMCIFLLAAGLSLLKTDGPRGGRIGPVVL